MTTDVRERMVKYYSTTDRSIFLRAAQGHFATSQSHINFYIDVTSMKSHVNEAREAARCLRHKLQNHVETIDTIVCLDGMEVLGGFLGDEIEKNGFHMTNLHETVYVVRPEENSIHQFMFRENNRPAIAGKNVLILVATMTTGETLKQALECIQYYGGIVVGVASIFSTMSKVAHTNVYTLFSMDDLPGYDTFQQHECPFCKRGIPIEAMVNGYGYSKL